MVMDTALCPAVDHRNVLQADQKKLGVIAPTKFESASGKKRKRVYNETLGFKYLYFIVGRRLR